MAQANTLKIFETLRPVFDEKHATKIAEAVEIALEENNNSLLEIVATKTDLERVKSDIIKWMFIFWIGQFATIVGTLTVILFSLLK